MTRVIPELLELLGRFLPPEVLAALVVLAAPVAVWGWLRWLRAKQIRGALRTAFLATDPQRRHKAIDRAFELAGKREHALVALLDTAHKTGLRDVTQRAMALMNDLGVGQQDVARITRELRPEARRAGHPVEEAVVIERFIEQELYGAARTRLAEAMQRFPDDEMLLDLSRQLAEHDGG